GGSIIRAEIHLSRRPKLFRQSEPPLATSVIAEGNAKGISFYFLVAVPAFVDRMLVKDFRVPLKIGRTQKGAEGTLTFALSAM
ncbi:hypothetical protein, partial [Hoeflea sp. AS16]|uniref:hypothetical protein n=1 Tax=Hoeflea sp. AS16 TaxID=3135779 RepID=UPI00317E2213